MSSDLVVGAMIVILVVASVSYIIYQRRKGISNCGCSGCSRCGVKPKFNVTIDEEECECCKKNRFSKTGIRLHRLSFFSSFSNSMHNRIF